MRGLILLGGLLLMIGAVPARSTTLFICGLLFVAASMLV
jgi:hypothetical protein